MDNKINYTFNRREHFFSVQKNYMLRLQRTAQGISVVRQENERIPAMKIESLDQSERFSGRMTAGGVYNQLANIRQIVFEITDACNLKCTYCSFGEFYGNYDKRENQYIDVKKAKNLIDFVFDKLHTPANMSQCKEVVISFYGGEPLMNVGFISEIVAYTQSKQDNWVSFKYSMTTNGVLLKKHIDFLLKFNFQILISLDGNEINDGHRKFHNGTSSFETVYNNVAYIRDNYPDFFDKQISFNAVLHNLNNESEVFYFFQREFNKIPIFSDVNGMGVKPDMQKDFDDMSKQKENTSSNELNLEMNRKLGLGSNENKNLQRFIFRYSGNVYRNYNELLKRTEKIKYIPTATCYPFSKKIFMTVNGKILPCERIGHQFALGNATETGVDIDCEEVAKKYNGYYDLVRKQCACCYQAGACIQCIYIIKNLEQKPVCQGFSNKEKFENYLRGSINCLSQNPEMYKRIMEEAIVIE